MRSVNCALSITIVIAGLVLSMSGQRAADSPVTTGRMSTGDRTHPKRLNADEVA